MSLGVISSHAVVGGGGGGYSAEVLADSPLVYWKLDETSGTSAADSSGNSRDATYTNSPTVGATSLLTSGSGKAMATAIDSGQCTTIASATWMNATALTVECLANLTTGSTDVNGDAIVSRLVALDWVLLREPGGKWEASVWNSSVARFNVISPAAVAANTTYHLAFTWDGSNLILYVNGSAVATTPTTGTIGTSSAPIEVARYSQAASTVPPGRIDEVAIYGTALSAARIAAHYAAA